MFALLDGNNFYVSCERVFRPELQGRPVVVLSNNDGCAISRSDEAKAIGVKMGQPYFQFRHLEKTAGLRTCSANFTLYGDMSDRMMSLAAGLGPASEPYSIDEVFVSLDGVPGDLSRRARAIRARVLNWIGLPTCIGIAPTKTLAKLANHIAKSAERQSGHYPPELAQVCHLGDLPQEMLQQLLHRTPVGDVWGVGRRLDAQLHQAGIHTAQDLARMSPALARQYGSVVLERTVRELQGTPCLSLDASPEPRHEVAVTRSFGHPVHELPPLTEAVSEFAARAAEKLRRQHARAGCVQVFIHTSPFRSGPSCSQSASRPLARPSADTTEITQAALHILRRIYRPGHAFIKAGVMLRDLDHYPHSQTELALSASPEPTRDRSALMDTLDALNQRFGAATVHLASSGLSGAPRHWVMRQQYRSPNYTTDFSQLPVVKV